MILYATLALCAFGAAVVVYRHDLYEREPLPFLALTVAVGMAAMWFAGWVEDWTLGIAKLSSAHAISAVAASEEETLKLLTVLVVALLTRRAPNDPMDGIVYGSMAGLGMAVEESVYYLRQFPPGNVLPPSELVRICGHLVMGGISGFAIWPFMMRRKRWPRILASCFLAATTLHFGWDWIVLASAGTAMGTLEIWSGATLMLAGLLLYGVLTAMASEQSRLLYAPTSRRQIWGWPFNRISRIRP